jgi:hypothetical protein
MFKGRILFCSLLILVCGFTCAYGQADQKGAEAKSTAATDAKTADQKNAEAKPTAAADAKTADQKSAEAKSTAAADAKPTPVVAETSPIKIFLISGGPMLVEEVAETNDGVWYKRGNLSTFIDRAKIDRIERPKPPSETPSSEFIEGPGKWKIEDAVRVEEFFAARFKRPLPLTAFGQSVLHTRWGLDHRNGMDVGLHPDSVEGRVLIGFLRTESIPFLAFRGPIPGVATGPHIHIGNRSSRFSER